MGVAISLVNMILSTNIVLLLLLLLFHSFQNHTAASPKTLAKTLLLLVLFCNYQEVSPHVCHFHCSPQPQGTRFDTQSLALKNYALPLQWRSPPFGSPHPIDPPRHKRFRHCPATALGYSKSHRR
jgi:hypothetical protein